MHNATKKKEKHIARVISNYNLIQLKNPLILERSTLKFRGRIHSMLLRIFISITDDVNNQPCPLILQLDLEFALGTLEIANLSHNTQFGSVIDLQVSKLHVFPSQRLAKLVF